MECPIAIGRRQRSSVALSLRGFIALWVLDGPINWEAFEAYAEQILVPDRRPQRHLDNLSSHKGSTVCQLMEAGGADLQYLPPYSPHFNPVENAFGKLKTLLLKAAPRSVKGLWSAISDLLSAFKPPECHNYVAAACYDAD